MDIYFLKASDEWLDSEDRVYPVTIDPIVESGKTVSKIKETYVQKSSPNSDAGRNTPYMKIGKPSNNTAIENEAYIMVETFPKIDKTARVVFAQLFLAPYFAITGNDYYTNENNFDPKPLITAHEVTGEWNLIGCNWNNKPTIDDNILDYEKVQSDDTYYQWNITSVVNKWYEKDPNINNGIALKMYETTPASNSWVNAYFSSSDVSSNVPVSHYPNITVTYRDTVGLEDYWSYHSTEINGSGSAFINDFNGNLTYVAKPIAGFTGERMPSNVSLVYNLSAINDTPFVKYGKGFRLNVTQRLLPSDIPNYPYYLIDSDGTKHFFSNKDNKIMDEDGLGLTITDNPNAYYDERRDISDKNGIIRTFDDWGYLRRIKDTNGNITYYNYSQIPNSNEIYLNSIADPSGRNIWFEYDSNWSLQKITNPDGSVTAFGYSGENLVSITDASGTANISYKIINGMESNFIDKIYENSKDTNNANKTYTQFDYEIGYTTKVVSYKEYGKNNILGTSISNIKYGYKQTTFTDNKNRKQTIQFNIFGSPTCVIDNEGNSSMYQYGDTTYTSNTDINAGVDKGTKIDRVNANKVTNTASTQKYINNLINNGSIGEGQVGLDKIGGGITEVNTTEKYLSSQSIKITNRLVNSPFTVVGNYPTTQAGRTYLASAYIKLDNVTGAESTGAGIEVVTSRNNKVYSEFLKGSANTTIDNGWQKVEVRVTLASDETINRVTAGLYNADGVIYVGGIQLELGIVANKTNLVSNSSFEQSFSNSSGSVVEDSTAFDGKKYLG